MLDRKALPFIFFSPVSAQKKKGALPLRRANLGAPRDLPGLMAAHPGRCPRPVGWTAARRATCGGLRDVRVPSSRWSGRGAHAVGRARPRTLLLPTNQSMTGTVNRTSGRPVDPRPSPPTRRGATGRCRPSCRPRSAFTPKERSSRADRRCRRRVGAKRAKKSSPSAGGPLFCRPRQHGGNVLRSAPSRSPSPSAAPHWSRFSFACAHCRFRSFSYERCGFCHRVPVWT